MRIRGGSMMPLLRDGMIVELAAVDADVERGEILVYRTASGRIFAHRVVGYVRDGFRTAGDAHPDALESIPAADIIGRVTAVWSADGTTARRVDGPIFDFVGFALTISRPFRALANRALRLVRSMLTLPPPRRVPRTFSALLVAMESLAAGNRAAFNVALAGVPAADLIATARRHHCTGILADAFGYGGDPRFGLEPLAEAFRRTRTATALAVAKRRREIETIARIFNQAQIDFILLKGAGRIYARESGADKQFSSDIDVLVRPEQHDLAIESLVRAGYRFGVPAKALARWSRHHHVAPLLAPKGGAPIEIHGALAVPPAVSQRYDFAALEPLSVAVEGAAGKALVLGRLAAALHLAYHARGLRPLRDVALLAEHMRAFDRGDRERFAALLARECADGDRVRAVATLAARIAGVPWIGSPCDERTLRWLIARENLPPALRGHALVAETIAFRGKVRFRGPDGIANNLPAWFASLLALPFVWWYMRPSLRGSLK